MTVQTFLSTNDYYYNVNNIDIRWFGAAGNVTRAPITGLGADGDFLWGNFLGGICAYWWTFFIRRGTVYEWRDEAGQALMHGGFDNFSNAFKGNYTSTQSWDINQLKSEQNLLQPIHEKYLKDRSLVQRRGAQIFNQIPNVKSYEDMS